MESYSLVIDDTRAQYCTLLLAFFFFFLNNSLSRGLYVTRLGGGASFVQGSGCIVSSEDGLRSVITNRRKKRGPRTSVTPSRDQWLNTELYKTYKSE